MQAISMIPGFVSEGVVENDQWLWWGICGSMVDDLPFFVCLMDAFATVTNKFPTWQMRMNTVL